MYEGTYTMIKEECVGHVQKRLGVGFQRYKKQNRRNVLSDGGRVGAPGRLIRWKPTVCDTKQRG